MPKKTMSKKTTKRHEMIDESTKDILSTPPVAMYPETGPGTSSTRWIVIAFVVIVALGAFLGSRGYIVAAMVNGKPVFRWDLEKSLNQRFGAQTLESMISERLIADTAAKQGVQITSTEVEKKMNDLVKTLGPNVKLDDLLKYQGMTKADFESQIKLQLTVEKLLGKDVAVSDSEVADYITKNKETLTATDEAALKTEAKDAVQSQKISEKIQPWFAEVKAKANIVRLVK
jgi:parvulin-like peptidyl-prolyl isomerase